MIQASHLSSRISPEVAVQRIKTFGERFGQAHLFFACHAAFPLALTPVLLYQLWANFQCDIYGEMLNIPWIAVADLLLSGLCEEVGHELYEMDIAIRNELLHQLRANSRFGKEQIYHLSNFLLIYVRQQLESHDPDVRDFAQAQRWTALAYTQPSEAAREIASTLTRLKLEEKAEWIRIATVVEAFAEPLAEFEPILIYARGMAKLAQGHVEAAETELKQLTQFASTAFDFVSLLEYSSSKIKSLEQTLSNQNRRVSSTPASSSNLELLQAIAHEVRTPLTTIRTLTRLLLRRKDLIPDVRKRLEIIDRECTEQIDRFNLISRGAELEVAHCENDSELLQAIAHEVRTPLTTIRTLTRLLLRRKDLILDVRKRLEIIDRECTEQIDRFSLIFRAVELETSQARSSLLSLSTISLTQMLQQNVPLWQQQVGKHNHTLEVSLPQELPLVITDALMLDQVLTGLIDRLVHALPSGSHIQIQVFVAGHQLKLLIKSYPPQEQSEDKHKFGSVPALKSLGQLMMFQPETGNLSLNIAVMKNLVQALGGKLLVQQPLQQGEELTIFLPLETKSSEEQFSEEQFIE